MREHRAGAAQQRPVRRSIACGAKLAVFLFAAIIWLGLPQTAAAQDYRFTSVEIEGNQRVSGATILSYAGIARGEALSAGALNDAYQKIVDSGLFETVEIVPQGNRLLIRVSEYPTINLINFEGNRAIKDDDLAQIVRSQSRRVYSPATAEADAAAIVAAYEQGGRLAATVEPKIIRRSDNRVDLVFEIAEGRTVEIERLSFVGNRNYSDRRLRRVLQTKQAGLLRALVRRDTFVADRIEFDKQVLRDFYLSRGYIDFQVLSVSSELTRRRDAFLLTFNIREGQSFDFGEITAVSDLAEIDPDEFLSAIRLRPGMTYSPVLVENTIARLERLAIRKGLDFIRVDPRITRNDRDLTLDVEFAIVKGPRIFVERIDIEGNATTLDRVVRRQFRTVEGDPFNPREIRESAERIRALGFFSSADVEAREGTSPDRVIVDVNVEEQPTGSLGFGLSYSASSGAGAAITFSERNFLGRGQALRFSFNTGTDNAISRLSFTEPAFLGRNVAFSFDAVYAVTDKENDELFRTQQISVGPSLTFPLSENGRLEVRYVLSQDRLYDYTGDSSIIADEAAEDSLITSALGYSFSYDTREGGLDPNSGILLRFGQDFAGVGGDTEFIETTALAAAQTRVWSEEVTLRAELEGGWLHMLDGNSRVTDRYFLNGKIRGFEPNGLGPRDPATGSGEALGGNMFAVARLEAEFPVGLPNEYGITGGVFADFGSVWSLDNTDGGVVDDDFNLRSSIGVSIFWTTPIGPLRFNFAKAIQKEDYDDEQTFDLTISTRF
ncbi:outer membrane protein insertion porin family [Rhodovulum iodosum]|uniref:Outer membrane protein assembly factor BamA n=1 Tax=Rhodovulum iodosum TaxID=68291 RepID=A0ABV3XU86_9RHOB|nr:outer membrane protein assembly factor BamA [Rhodovulum robiginosum]RSK38499.1 outer membrane protein assembly factor BamA [Rhodovulum robiginosum]